MTFNTNGTALYRMPTDRPKVVIIYSLEWAEYRVPGLDNTEEQIYFTDDKEDALDTAKAIFGANADITFQDME